MFHTAIPVLHVSSSAAAEAFYCEQRGFERIFAYRIKESQADPCYMGLRRGSDRLHVSSFSGDSVVGGAVYVVVDDVDALHTEFEARRVAISMEPTDQTWGNREMYINEPDGNCVRFVRESIE